MLSSRNANIHNRYLFGGRGRIRVNEPFSVENYSTALIESKVSFLVSLVEPPRTLR